MTSVQRRRSRVAVVVLVAGAGLLLTPLPPQVGLSLVLVACVLVAGGSRA